MTHTSDNELRTAALRLPALAPLFRPALISCGPLFCSPAPPSYQQGGSRGKGSTAITGGANSGVADLRERP